MTSAIREVGRVETACYYLAKGRLHVDSDLHQHKKAVVFAAEPRARGCVHTPIEGCGGRAPSIARPNQQLDGGREMVGDFVASSVAVLHYWLCASRSSIGPGV